MERVKAIDDLDCVLLLGVWGRVHIASLGLGHDRRSLVGRDLLPALIAWLTMFWCRLEGLVAPLSVLGNKPIFLYAQWAYSVWQLVRGYPLIQCLFCGFSLVHGKGQRKYTLEPNGMKLPDMVPAKGADYRGFRLLEEYECDEVISGQKPKNEFFSWFKCSYGGYYYLCNGSALRNLQVLMGTDNIYLKNSVNLFGDVHYAERISYIEFIELLLTRDFSMIELKGLVLYQKNWNVEMSFKVLSFLATIPLLAQARGCQATSTLLSIAVLLLDVCRTPIFRIYDRVMLVVVAWVKLNIFRNRTCCYQFMTLFSSRWSYCDVLKKYAYVNDHGEYHIRRYAKFRSRDDCTFIRGCDYNNWWPSPEEQQAFIDPDNIHLTPMMPATELQMAWVRYHPKVIVSGAA